MVVVHDLSWLSLISTVVCSYCTVLLTLVRLGLCNLSSLPWTYGILILLGVGPDWSIYIHISRGFLLFLSYPPPSLFRTHIFIHQVNSAILYAILYEVFHMLFAPGLLPPSIFPRKYLWIYPADYVHLFPILPCLFFRVVVILTSSLCLLYFPPLLDQTTAARFVLLDLNCANTLA